MVTALDMMSGNVKLVNPQKKKNSNETPSTTNTIGTKSIGKLSGKKKFGKAKVVNEGRAPYICYPIARGPQEKTGDTLLIKCIKYFPPGEGLGLEMQIDNALALKESGRVGAITQQDIKEDAKKDVSERQFTDKNGKALPVNIDVNFRSGQQRLIEKQEIQYYIELPAPQEISDSNSVTWGDDTLNALELAALNVASEAIGAGGEGVIQTAQTAVQGLQRGFTFSDGQGGSALEGDITNSVRAAISGAAVGALGGNVSAQTVLARSTGQILNSNTELLFNSVNLRSFPFTITFTPRSPKEALVVKQIIKSFKKSMAAKAGEFNGSSATGFFLKSPDVFHLQYLHNGEPHKFLNAFKICALTAMSVNYTNAGTYSSYSDGTPVAIRLNMTFKEINPIYSEDYDTDLAGDGVGY